MKITSYIFLFSLFIVLIFILGVRYGQKVEKNNKVVDYILKISPYPTYTPYPTIPPPSETASVSPIIKK